MALPVELYRDPERIVSDEQQGDVVPLTKHKPLTCFACRYVRPSLYGPPCAIHCCPSTRTGRCRCWESLR